MSGPADFTIGEARSALDAKDLSASELLDAVLDRASLTEANIHAYLTIDYEGAKASASAADEKLAAGDSAPLLGIPVALKDNMSTRGLPTTAGSKILDGYLPPYDATVVTRFREAGSVAVGKTNLDEFAMGSSTENSAYGVTRNPWNPDRVPGGSSGGAAASVAAGSALGSVGSDTGGSIRQPAAFCGLVGMKPTYGRVSRYGLIAFASSLDQIGPLTRNVEDSAMMLQVIAGHDPRDATSYPGDVPDFSAKLHDGVKGLRIGVVKELSGEGIDHFVMQAFRTTLERLEEAGAQIVDVSIPSTKVSLSAYYLIAPAECSANLARFDGVRYGLRSEGKTVDEMMSRTRAEGFGAEVIRRVLLGTYALSAGYYDAFYGQAQRVRAMTINEFSMAYQDLDVLVSPTTPTTAFEFDVKTADPLSMYMSDVCTIPSNLTGDPSISVPVGSDADGMPIGFQIMAPALSEALLFRAAQAVEDVSPSLGRPTLHEVAS